MRRDLSLRHDGYAHESSFAASSAATGHGIGVARGTIFSLSHCSDALHTKPKKQSEELDALAHGQPSARVRLHTSNVVVAALVVVGGVAHRPAMHTLPSSALEASHRQPRQPVRTKQRELPLVPIGWHTSRSSLHAPPASQVQWRSPARHGAHTPA